MNTEAAKNLINKLSTDNGFANRFKEETTIDSLVSLMHREGLECSNQDFKETSGPLTDDELEAVSGGTPDSSISFLEAYCKNVPLGRVQAECFNVLEKLKGSTE